ncbi:MAG: right-handed parallel beta-helix repeat-containing protein [Anaerolineae bacterium]
MSAVNARSGTRRLTFILCLAALLLLPWSASASDTPSARNKASSPALEIQAAVRKVGKSCSYPTITAALQDAVNGDILLLEGGATFTENLVIDVSVTIQGGYNGCASGSGALTTINGNNLGRTIYINPFLTVTLRNLIVTGGATTGNGSGILVQGGSQLNGDNIIISHNSSSAGNGGGVALIGAGAAFTNTEIIYNTAVYGGGVYGAATLTYYPRLDLVDNVHVDNNSASLAGEGQGGGLFMQQGNVTASGSTSISYNHASYGGGIFLLTSTITLTGAAANVVWNISTYHGGGIYARDGAVLIRQGSTIGVNTAGDSTHNGSGGGIYLDHSSLGMNSGRIVNNSSHGPGAGNYGGGGIYAGNSSLVLIDLVNSACHGPRCNLLAYNHALGGGWGGALAGFYSNVAIFKAYIEENDAAGGGDKGGAIFMGYSDTLYLANDYITRNSSQSGADGLSIVGMALTAEHVTLADNPANGTGSAVNLDTTSSLNMTRSIIWGHASSISALGKNVVCSDIQGGYAGANNLNMNPLFVDNAGGDYHLRPSSPLIDRCAAGLDYDADNEHRPTVIVRPATPYDMGADEVNLRLNVPVTFRN